MENKGADMTDMYRKLFDIARQCIDIVKKYLPDYEDGMLTSIEVGEPDLAVVMALDAACVNHEILRQIPESVKELTKNPDYPEIQRFADLFK